MFASYLKTLKGNTEHYVNAETEMFQPRFFYRPRPIHDVVMQTVQIVVMHELKQDLICMQRRCLQTPYQKSSFNFIKS